MKDLVVYKSTRELITQGLYFQLWVRLVTRAKRYMHRRKQYLVENGKVKDGQS